MSWLFTKPHINGVDPAEANRRRGARTTIVVDVREAHELRDGTIAGARHIPLGRLHEHVDELLAAPEVIFVCRSGNRSASATAALTRAGHANAHNMVGGMIAWSRKNLPIQR